MPTAVVESSRVPFTVQTSEVPGGSLLWCPWVSPQPCSPSPSACKKNYLQGMATIAQRLCLFNVLLPPGTETVTLPIASLQLPFAFLSCLLTVTFQSPWYSCLGDDKGWGLCSACDADRHKCERFHPDSLAKPPWLPGLESVCHGFGCPHRAPGIALASASPWEILARHLQKEAQSQHNNSEFTEDQKKTIAKIATCLELRSAALQSTHSQDEFKLEDLKKLEPILKNILTYNKEFPFDVQPVPLRKILAPGEEEHLEFEEDDEEGGAGAGSPDSFPARVPGTLLPRLPSEPGMTLLTINIEKIGLKDAGQCIDPYITVSVKDLNGIDLTPVQDTPVALRKEDTYVHFNVDIEIQKHIERLTKGMWTRDLKQGPGALGDRQWAAPGAAGLNIQTRIKIDLCILSLSNWSLGWLAGKGEMKRDKNRAVCSATQVLSCFITCLVIGT
uniref:Axin interactor, dorsalization associated n=1 Tax=Cyanoderma ruficeps TaxID=181631 RepID=A0A8C3R2U6_9PASS